MFSALFHRAQATVDNAIGQVVNRALIAIPFTVAAAFATAALFMRLTTYFGSEQASLMVAAIFTILGTLAFLLFGRSPSSSETAAASAEPLAASAEEASAVPDLSSADRELLLAALTSAAPVALPALMRAILRNLPLIVVILASLFVMTRSPAPDQAESPPAPA